MEVGPITIINIKEQFFSIVLCGEACMDASAVGYGASQASSLPA
jgi:hypothetical protein